MGKIPTPGPSWAFRTLKILGIVAAIYSAVCGLVVFPLFILEEATQMGTFGNFAAKAARDWDQIERNCNAIESANETMLWINRYFGWVNPFSYAGYDRYGRNTAAYIQSARSMAAEKKKKRKQRKRK
jgi:hypothetical protein